MREKIKSILFLFLPILFTIGISYYLQSVIISNQQEVAKWLSGFGSYVILIYIILQAITLIIAPIGGFFLVVAMIALFGPGLAFILAYFVTTPCYLVNFYLSNKYGRPLVQKIIGKEMLEKTDRFVENSGVSTLIIFRIFQSGNFDYLSYALGLTKIPFKTFALINIFAGIPAMYIAYFIYSRSATLTQGVITGYIVGFLFAVLSIFFNQLIHKR